MTEGSYTRTPISQTNRPELDMEKYVPHKQGV